MADLTLIPGSSDGRDPETYYDRLKPKYRGGMRRYIEERIPTGSFLRAVLENDLYSAARRADLESRRDLYDLCMWLQWNAPKACFGSKQAVAEWLAPSPPPKEAA